MEAICVLGAGGIGCAVGSALLSARRRVRFVDRHPGKLDAGNQHGVHVTGQPPRHSEFVHFDEWNPHPDEIHLLCTKCYDNQAVLARLPRGAVFVPIQNGFDPSLAARGHQVEAIASFVSECAPDRPCTRITRRGNLHIGPRAGESGRPSWLGPLVRDLSTSRLFRTVEVNAIEPYKYTKLMYNAAIAPLAAAAGIDNGQLLSRKPTRRLFFAFIQENFAILQHARIPLGRIGPFHPSTVAKILRRRWLANLFSWFFEPSLRGTYCSMTGDLPRGRTEIDYYNQKLIDLAGEHPCPFNRAAVTLIKRMESNRLAPSPDVLNDLAGLLEKSGAPVPAGPASDLPAPRNGSTCDVHRRS